MESSNAAETIRAQRSWIARYPMPFLGRSGLAFHRFGTTGSARARHDICKPDHPVRLLNETIDETFRDKHNLNAIGDKKLDRAMQLSALPLECPRGDEEFARCTRFSIVRIF